ncbi:20216_t:CDS:2 [Entrophospora sp. SA101]|nr:20216_t:CDS:2 [Entrophospora sp. SA101]CAJ0841517.1 15856_t:CDS:2 [Entrophospora sp. SA101]CAJ0921669.1 6901_t:CDS:2 [Entrophospora sp. SA101]
MLFPIWLVEYHRNCTIAILCSNILKDYRYVFLFTKKKVKYILNNKINGKISGCAIGSDINEISFVEVDVVKVDTVEVDIVDVGFVDADS